MDIQFLYFEDCPSHDQALERLRGVLAEEGVADEVAVIRVETDEQARQWRFTGSPTIRIDGADIQPPPDPQYRLACRIYRLEDGRISPLPSPDMIRQAVRQARAGGQERP